MRFACRQVFSFRFTCLSSAFVGRKTHKKSAAINSSHGEKSAEGKHEKRDEDFCVLIETQSHNFVRP